MVRHGGADGFRRGDGRVDGGEVRDAVGVGGLACGGVVGPGGADGGGLDGNGVD